MDKTKGQAKAKGAKEEADPCGMTTKRMTTKRMTTKRMTTKRMTTKRMTTNESARPAWDFGRF